MNPYYQAFKSYESIQQAAALVLFGLGLALGLGWLLIDSIIPGRWQPYFRWAYLLGAGALVSLSVYWVGR